MPSNVDPHDRKEHITNLSSGQTIPHHLSSQILSIVSQCAPRTDMHLHANIMQLN